MVESYSFTYKENGAFPKSVPSEFSLLGTQSSVFFLLTSFIGFTRQKLAALLVICTSEISSIGTWSRKIFCSLRMATSVWQTLVSAKRTCTTVRPLIRFAALQRLVETWADFIISAVFSTRDPAKKAVHALHRLVVPRGSHLRDGVRVAAVLLDQRRRNVPGYPAQAAQAEEQCKRWDARLLVKDFGEESPQSPGPCSRRLVTNSKSRFLQIDQFLRFTSQKISPGVYSSRGKWFQQSARCYSWSTDECRMDIWHTKPLCLDESYYGRKTRRSVKREWLESRLHTSDFSDGQCTEIDVDIFAT